MNLKRVPLFDYIDQQEYNLCLRINQLIQQPVVLAFFAVVSRLGNGVFWYTLMSLIALLQGLQALPVLGHMVLSGVLGVLIYKVLKLTLIRQRPFITFTRIVCGTAPLDVCSFPSGHTLHAVSFNTILFLHYPVLAWLVLPFTLLTALSRIVLGLHYPTDVLMGGFIGLVLAFSCHSFF